MRCLLAVILVCAIAAPPAYAASSKSSGKTVSASKSEQGSKTGKHARRNSSGAGGIHPLVGSGDY